MKTKNNQKTTHGCKDKANGCGRNKTKDCK